jgi:hypothetical protein
MEDEAAVRKSFEVAGVIFVDGKEPGVRLKRRGRPDEGIRVNELTSENNG